MKRKPLVKRAVEMMKIQEEEDAGANPAQKM
jgi:hypothetical protein